jgi:hypothetical protein
MLELFLLYTNSYGKLLFIDRGKVRYQNDYCTRVTVNIIVLHIVAVSLHAKHMLKLFEKSVNSNFLYFCFNKFV